MMFEGFQGSFYNTEEVPVSRTAAHRICCRFSILADARSKSLFVEASDPGSGRKISPTQEKIKFRDVRGVSG